MADKKRQHTVPQVYLKNFATPQKKKRYIYVFQKTEQTIVFTEIGNAAVERDFYKLDAAERPLGWEDFYSEQIEPQTGLVVGGLIKKASPSLLRPRTTILNRKERASLALYMMYQVARGRAAREFMVPITKKTADEVAEKLKAEYALNVDDQLRAYIKSGLSKVAMAEASINPTRMKNLAEHLLSRYWVLYRIDGEAEFITSDNPVMFADNSTQDQKRYAEEKRKIYNILNLMRSGSPTGAREYYTFALNRDNFRVNNDARYVPEFKNFVFRRRPREKGSKDLIGKVSLSYRIPNTEEIPVVAEYVYNSKAYSLEPKEYDAKTAQAWRKRVAESVLIRTVALLFRSDPFSQIGEITITGYMRYFDRGYGDDQCKNVMRATITREVFERIKLERADPDEMYSRIMNGAMSAGIYSKEPYALSEI